MPELHPSSAANGDQDRRMVGERLTESTNLSMMAFSRATFLVGFSIQPVTEAWRATWVPGMSYWGACAHSGDENIGGGDNRQTPECASAMKL